MVHLFRVRTRIAIGSNLGIVLLAAVFGLIGKQITGQILWAHAVALVIGAIGGARLGAHLSGRFGTKTLRFMIHLIIAAAAVRMWYQVMTGQ
jgi:uncharacterized membrane protein YfcA